MLKHGAVNESYIISNDITAIFTNQTGVRVFAKDADGDALNISTNTDNKPVPEALQGKEYDQSNWVEIVLPEALGDITLNDKSLISHTVVGKLVDKTNPKIEVVAYPLPGNSEVEYTPNVYIPASFVEQNDYFFVTPKANEYCHVAGACYSGEVDGKPVFTMGNAAGNNLNGSFAIMLDDYTGEDSPSFIEGKLYELVGIVKSNAAGGLMLSLLSYTQREAPVVVGDLNDDGAVDIADVNICINIILGSNNDPIAAALADLNGDRTVDISDVNALINIILTN